MEEREKGTGRRRGRGREEGLKDGGKEEREGE